MLLAVSSAARAVVMAALSRRKPCRALACSRLVCGSGDGLFGVALVVLVALKVGLGAGERVVAIVRKTANDRLGGR